VTLRRAHHPAPPWCCAICLADHNDPADDPRNWVALGCGHNFHDVCVRGWLAQGHSTCPLCRARSIRRAPGQASTSGHPSGPQPIPRLLRALMQAAALPLPPEEEQAPGSHVGGSPMAHNGGGVGSVGSVGTVEDAMLAPMHLVVTRRALNVQWLLMAAMWGCALLLLQAICNSVTTPLPMHSMLTGRGGGYAKRAVSRG
jgi:hypothetical protein